MARLAQLAISGQAGQLPDPRLLVPCSRTKSRGTLDIPTRRGLNAPMPRLPEQVPLYQLFLHNAWATEKLLDSCEPLTAEQLRATVPGAVGSLFETLHHFVQAEGGYLSRLAPELTPAHWEPRLAKTFEAVRSRARELKPLWLTFAATDPDAAQLHRKRWPDVTHEFPAYMEMAQALFHSHTHREQACMIVTSLGLEPPDLQPIAWADEIGALRRIR